MNRNIANRMLLAVFCLFIAAAALKHYYPGRLAVNMLFIVTEAALVGGIADWFAVTALFRRPLGFPWHTELIPRNRDRVTQSIVLVVEQDLLSAEAIQKRLAGICFMDLFIDWVDNKNGKHLVGQLAAKAAQRFLEGLDPEKLEQHIQRFIQQHIEQLIMLPELESAGKWALRDGRVEQALQFMLDELRYVVNKPRTLEAIYRYLDQVKDRKAKSLAARLVVWLGEQTDSINTREAARSLQKELVSLLAELKEPEHPIHVWAVSRISENIRLWARDPAFHQALSEWTAATLQPISFRSLIEQVLKTAIHSLRQWQEDGGDSNALPPLMLWVFEQAAAYWHGFKQDPEIHEWVEQYVKRVLFRLVETEHHLIGRIVKEALEEFDNQALSEFIEDKAGDDLQWIRINGSIVGGAVGLLLFLFLYFIYDPWIVPLVRSLLL